MVSNVVFERTSRAEWQECGLHGEAAFAMDIKMEELGMAVAQWALLRMNELINCP